ncbi:rhodanese-like domain-containing protein [Planctomyces sp. SH-PL62]|uniref:rhodanese-like domain-containing protein n=1 Tax=Planctomyces sp. SH-PL62 TaxID=1636152 RepID=UPI00078B429F|nr:rhodanese-like domain-containing protein [Planctomyces sp. SH-PL62]AMV39980.1 putative adenylyltransferase/sulfurtransferase MoeZ [Planctomyces sp. SH-PL62]
MSTETPGPIAEVTATALRDRLAGAGPITLLDVREPHERAFAAIPVQAPTGDLFIPMRKVPASLDAIREALDRGPVVVYCHHGVRSMRVAEWLAERGLNGVVNLRGGIDAWSIDVAPEIPRYS